MDAKFLAIVSAAALSACAHAPVNLAGCDLPMTRLAVPEPPAKAARFENDAGVQPPASGFAAAIAAAMAPPPALQNDAGVPQAPQQRPVSLFLSGGSQNGAFGAGFIDEWRIQGGGALPAFRVVTGISTGSLIGTTVFIGASDRAVAGYTINAESDLVDVKARGLVAQVRAGAAGTLDPLRRRLDATFDRQPGDDALLGEIAAADADKRKFFVGIVDAREGEAYAVDMTALAARWAAASTPAARQHIKQCYIDTLIASSSVPLSAPPVYIDGRMWIDGGLRFSVFSDAMANAMESARAAAAAAKAPAPAAFVIVNGKWDIEPQCVSDEVVGPDGIKRCEPGRPLKKWDILDLGFRSISILTNQVARFSADAAAGPGDRFVRIEADAPDHPFREKTCSQWRAIDETDKPKPLQFHKREMLCLIDYGRKRARDERWWTVK
jgi:hypothetical protein